MKTRLTKVSSTIHAQIGTKPGFKKDVLIILIGGECLIINILKKQSNKLQEMGLSTEG